MFLKIFACVLILSACHRSQIPTDYGHLKNIDTTIGIKQRVYVTDRNVTNIENKLKSLGVTVLSVGQDYRVIIPAELIYYYESPKLRWHSFGTINLVVDFLKQFRAISMRVDTYSQDKDKKRAGALSLARARALVDYLWSQAINTRLLYTQAHIINRSPSACCGDLKGRSDVPTRVEITFRNSII